VADRLVIWTGGKIDVVKEALEPAFKRLPQVPENITVPFNDDCLLAAEQGDVVLAMGNKCLRMMQSHKLCHGGRSLDSMRQKPIAGPNGGVYFVTLDPFMVRTQADAPSLIRQDVALASRYALTGKLEPELGHYMLVEDFGPLVQQIENLFEAGHMWIELACDTETVGLHPEASGARILTIQFTLDEGSASVYEVPEDGKLPSNVQAQVEWLLTHPRIILCGANWKYDSRWIHRQWGILCTNLKRDVLLMGSLVDENRSNSLKTHAWEYTLLGGYDQLEAKGYDKAHMELIPIEEIVPYAGCDTDVTLQSSRKIKTEMSPELVRLYQTVSLPASAAFEAMEHEGVYVDLDEFAKLRAELSAEMEAKEHEMLGLLPGRLKMKYAEKIKDQLEAGKSPLVPSLLKDYFFSPYGLNLKPKILTEKTQEPSTAKSHLTMFFDVAEAKLFVDALEAHGSASKTRSTFVDGFLKHLRADGRLHPSYMLFAGSMFGDDDDDAGTVTGRTSCKEPAFQCLEGGSLIYSNSGKVVIQDLVSRYEEGERFKVQTHTGAWRDVVGVYRNGVRPVFKVRTRLGREINCTSNHPLLTDRGFVETGRLRVGDAVFVAREWAIGESDRLARDAVRAAESATPRPGSVTETALDLQMRLRCGEVTVSRELTHWEHEVVRVLAEGTSDHSRQVSRGEELPPVCGVAARESEVLQLERPRFPELRGERHRDVPRMAGQFREVRGGYGKARHRPVTGPQGRERPILEEQLSMGYGHGAATEPTRHLAGDLARRDPLRLGVGPYYRHGFDVGGEVEPRMVSREGLHDARQAAQAGYVLDEIVSIEYVGERETFDLTIDRCHSFIGDGLVVHNTIPKKTKWAKKLRACYPAPPGQLICAFDYSQGELKVVACVASEENMIASFEQGLDLHSVTAAAFMGISYDEFKALEQTDLYSYTLYRTAAKAGNFGLLYGMKEEGFRTFARNQYGVTMSMEDTVERRNRFFEMYPGLLDYHDMARKFARTHGYVESPLGRRRNLPLIHSPDNKSRSDAERQAINAPIQSTLNELALYAAGQINIQLPQLHGFGMVHDQLLYYIDEDKVHLAKQAQLVMDNLPIKEKLGWDHRLSFTSDGELGPRLNQLSKL
jgi:DNA polymerase I-like protein with 3'-5' exonuclease and polymerase domains